MAFSDLLPSRAMIQRQGSTSANGMGPSHDTGPWTTVTVDGQPLIVQCRVAQQSQRVRQRTIKTDKDVIVSTPTIFTTYRTDLKPRDRFMFIDADNNPLPGQVYDTSNLDDPGQVHDHLEFVSQRVS